MRMAIRFDGKVAIVTGAGGGLGRAHALELARRGAKVVVNDLGAAVDGSGGSSKAAQDVVAEIKALGREAIANGGSVSDREGAQSIVRDAVQAFGTVDILINNAGILRDKTFAKLAPEDLEIVLDVHLKGAFYVSQPAFRAMKEQNYGRLLFTASGAGIFGNFGQANYGAAKMGLVGLSNVLAQEGAKNNIKSNVIAPIAKTRLTEQLLGPIADKLAPECVTPLAVYLVSEQCELTHEIFDVGGGRYARIFIGMNPGWAKGAGQPATVEEIAAHIDQIRDPQGYIIPSGIGDEMRMVANLIQGK
jgi:NAD(P)-dependent dehydrogenase (short-subunit alcohol dehydrogenase family)